MRGTRALPAVPKAEHLAFSFVLGGWGSRDSRPPPPRRPRAASLSGAPGSLTRVTWGCCGATPGLLAVTLVVTTVSVSRHCLTASGRHDHSVVKLTLLVTRAEWVCLYHERLVTFLLVCFHQGVLPTTGHGA